MKILTPAEQQAIRVTSGASSSSGSGSSILTLALLAGVAYGGYRIYKHFRKD